MLRKTHHRILWFQVLAVLTFVAVGNSTLCAQDDPIRDRLALPGEACRTPPVESWTPQEKWVWTQVCQGKEANFNSSKTYGGSLDPKKDTKWPESRILRSSFLETLLLHEPYRAALTRKGVRIAGAWLKGPLDLSSSTLSDELELRNCRFGSVVDLSRLRSSKSITFSSCKFSEALSMTRLQIQGHLRITRAEADKDVYLNQAKIGEGLDVDGTFSGGLEFYQVQVGQDLFVSSQSTFSKVSLGDAKIGGSVHIGRLALSGKLSMNGMQVGQNLYMSNRTNFSDVDLRGARITGNIQTNGSTFSGKLIMNDVRVGQSLRMGGATKFSDVELNNARVEGQIDMSGSTFSGKLGMNSVEVGQNLFMNDKAKFLDVDLQAAKVGGSLLMGKKAKFVQVDLAGAKIGGYTIMDGSTFSGKLNMDGVQVGRELWMRDKATFAEVNLRGAKIGSQIAMNGSTFSGKLNMNALRVEDNILMYGGARFAEVDLSGAKINGQVAMCGSTFKGKLNMNGIQAGDLAMHDKARYANVDLSHANIESDVSMGESDFSGKLVMRGIRVGQGLFMGDKASFTEVDLSNAEIGGQVAMGESTFSGLLNMDSIKVGQNLIMQKARFAEVDLSGAKIDGQIGMGASTFSGEMNMRYLQVRQHVFMGKGAIFEKPLKIDSSNINGSLDLSGGTFASANVTRANIEGDLVLGPPAARWLKGATMTLRDVRAGGLQCSRDAWPDNLELDGFIYTRFGAFSADDKEEVNVRDVGWLMKWLAKQKRYTPQPYKQLAQVLQKEGFKDEAEQILYAGRNRELEKTTGFLNKLWLFTLKYFIGYGYYPLYYTVFWVVGFVFVGMLFLWLSNQGPANKMPYGIAYSIDMLLPIIRLREKHYQIDLKGYVRYWFYFHKIMGWVLASFLIAGLAKLTQQ